MIGREKGEAAVFWVGFTGTGTGKETKRKKRLQLVKWKRDGSIQAEEKRRLVARLYWFVLARTGCLIAASHGNEVNFK